jgi:hypothetical protein
MTNYDRAIKFIKDDALNDLDNDYLIIREAMAKNNMEKYIYGRALEARALLRELGEIQ